MTYNVLSQIENTDAMLKGLDEFEWLQYHTKDKIFVKNLVPIPYDRIKGICVPLTSEDKNNNKTVVLTTLTVRGFQNYIAKLES